MVGRLITVVVILLGLNACVQLKSVPISQQTSNAQNTRIHSIVLHFTAADYSSSLYYLKDSGHVSAHYLIPDLNDHSYQEKKLKVVQLVEDDKRAWHAGYSFWQGRDNLNDTSIGIEITNAPVCGHNDDPVTSVIDYPEYGPEHLCTFPEYSPEQIQLLVKLLHQLLEQYPDVDATRVIGHSDVAPQRKSDPGPRFPWYQLYQQGIGAWYEQDTVDFYWQMFQQISPSVGLVQEALATYGYQIEQSGRFDLQTRNVLYAFQSHFLPTGLTSKPDPKTASALFALIEKYRPDDLPHLLTLYFNETMAYASVQKEIDDNSGEVVYEKTQAFYGLQGQGKIRLHNKLGVRLPKLTVNLNGQLIEVDSQESEYELDVSSQTRDGDNIVSVRSELGINDVELSLHMFNTQAATGDLARQYQRLISDYTGDKDNQVELVTSYKGQWASSINAKGRIGLGVLESVLLYPMAIYQLEAEGKLTLTDPINKYLPEYQGDGREFRKIYHLLEHLAGYGRQTDKLITSLKGLSIAEFKANVLTQVPYQYGLMARQEHSYTASVILAFIVEAVTGSDINHYIKNEILPPLGIFHEQIASFGSDGFVQSGVFELTAEDISKLMQEWLVKQDNMPLLSKNSIDFSTSCVMKLTSTSLLFNSANEMLLIDRANFLTLFLSLKNKVENVAEPTNLCNSNITNQILLDLYGLIFQMK